MVKCIICMAKHSTSEAIMLEAYRPNTDFAALIKGELLVLFALSYD